MNSDALFTMEQITDLRVKTSKGSSRKYPNVIWFPRSKTDPQEIREVLKLALHVQNSSPEKTFNDKTLGEYMAKVGSINVVGMQGEEYIDAYKGKSIGDVSYITNARMLMRLFRFLGLVSRMGSSKYRLTDLGILYTVFSGDYPSVINGESEEQVLLQSLKNFAFYSVNDDSNYRDASFKMRPFIWLLNGLAIEPQCIYQLIVTVFASKSESNNEIERIKALLNRLKVGKTTLKEEFERVGLDADDYSCVHNFYDSAKILVYLGSSLGLITKTSNPEYGREIAGKARNLKQANIFYCLTDKGKKYLNEAIQHKVVYYDEIYRQLGKDVCLQASFVLASLNFVLGSTRIVSINNSFYKRLLGDDWHKSIELLENKLEIEIEQKQNWVSLKTPISFNFWQSIPPEFFYLPIFQSWYKSFINEVKKGNASASVKITKEKVQEEFSGLIVSEFILDTGKHLSYPVPAMTIDEAQEYIKYKHEQTVYGGQDRFSTRVSPTNSIMLVGDEIHVDNEKDTLDLIAPLRFPDSRLVEFVHNNIDLLVANFIAKSDNWEKDQHYTWVRNCFRLFGAEAIYSGSSGMLMRADVSIINPFIGGIEAKSPRENRGSINTKAIRQAVDAKIQVASKNPSKRNLPRAAIAIGRRVTPLAIEEEKKYASEGQPVLLLSDIVLYFLTLKTVDIPFGPEDIIGIFTKNRGLFGKETLWNSLEKVMVKKSIDRETQMRINNEIDRLNLVLANGDDSEKEED